VNGGFYEALVPLTAAQLATLREADEPALARLEIDDVGAAQTDEHGLHIAVLLRDPQRPGCVFGWRWSWAEDPRSAELEFAAEMLRVNLEEDVLSDRYGLPADCTSAGVTWF
jgi:hypothetical protein